MPKTVAKKPSKRVSKQPAKSAKSAPKADEASELAQVLKEAFAKAATEALPAGRGQPGLPLGDKSELSIKEASALTGYTSQLLMEAIHESSLKASKKSGRWVLARNDLEDWIRKL